LQENKTKHTSMHAHACTLTHTHTQARARARAHTHTHTHTHSSCKLIFMVLEYGTFLRKWEDWNFWLIQRGKMLQTMWVTS